MNSPDPQTTILVVEGTAPAFRQLTTQLQTLNDDWNLIRLHSCADVPQVLADTPAVVVAAPFSPDSNDAADATELFTWLKEEYPEVVRIGLISGEEAPTRIELGALVQHWLRAEDSPPTLHAALRGAIWTQGWLSDPALRRLLSQIHHIPSVPRLYFGLLDSLQTPDVSVQAVGEIVRQDPAMTAKILQLVNSSYFALSRKIHNPAEAVAYVGIDRIRPLVLMVHFFSAFQEGIEPRRFSVERLWQHSYATASMAAEIGEYESADAEFIHDSFTAGLLHDIGKLALAANMPDRYEKVVRRAEAVTLPLWKVERQEFGTTHADLGGCLAGMWGLPGSIVEAIAFHHLPKLSGNLQFSPLVAVYLANVFENQRGTHSDAPDSLDEEFLDAIDRKPLISVWKKMMTLKSGSQFVQGNRPFGQS